MERKRVTVQEYAAAVVALLRLEAHRGTSGAKAAAQVLLSAYNGSEFQLDVTDLCNLSGENLQAALTVIQGRVDTGVEPHTLVKGGGDIFPQMWERWESLHVAERGKQLCGDCRGVGKVYVNFHDERDERMTPCTECGGAGRYWPR